MHSVPMDVQEAPILVYVHVTRCKFFIFIFLIEPHSDATQKWDTSTVLSILWQRRFKINSAVFLWASLKWTYPSHCLS